MFGAWGLVSRNPTGSGTAFYAFDQRGNVAQRVNGSGTLLSTDVYDAYGKKRSGPADVFGFGGQGGYYTDGETGLILCTHRFYDPQQGRFLTRDPIGYAGGINLYGYTQNNPINGMDPDGFEAAPLPSMPSTTAATPAIPGRHFPHKTRMKGTFGRAASSDLCDLLIFVSPGS